MVVGWLCCVHLSLTGAAFKTVHCAACFPACFTCAEAPTPPPTSHAASALLPPRQQRQLMAAAMQQLLRPTSMPSGHSRFCCPRPWQSLSQIAQLLHQLSRRQQAA
jgi:hypothetical protein